MDSRDCGSSECDALVQGGGEACDAFWGEGAVAWRWEEWRQDAVVEILRRTKGSSGL